MATINSTRYFNSRLARKAPFSFHLAARNGWSLTRDGELRFNISIDPSNIFMAKKMYCMISGGPMPGSRSPVDDLRRDRLVQSIY